MSAGGTIARVAGAGIAVAAAYALFLGHRPDYLGHFVAGYGATLLLLVLPLVAFRTPVDWQVLALVLFAVALGGLTEATIFRLAIFDPVDFLNQSIGAALAGASLVGRRGSLALAAGVAPVSLAFVATGFVFAGV